jgi:hypothetical protein
MRLMSEFAINRLPFSRPKPDAGVIEFRSQMGGLASLVFRQRLMPAEISAVVSAIVRSMNFVPGQRGGDRAGRPCGRWCSVRTPLDIASYCSNIAGTDERPTEPPGGGPAFDVVHRVKSDPVPLRGLADR